MVGGRRIDAVVTDFDGRIVKHTNQVKPGDPLHVQVSDGTIGVTVGGAPGARKRIKPPPGEDNQGSLF